jgi:hypothetical protein
MRVAAFSVREDGLAPAPEAPSGSAEAHAAELPDGQWTATFCGGLSVATPRALVSGRGQAQHGERMPLRHLTALPLGAAQMHKDETGVVNSLRSSISTTSNSSRSGSTKFSARPFPSLSPTIWGAAMHGGRTFPAPLPTASVDTL